MPIRAGRSFAEDHRGPIMKTALITVVILSAGCYMSNDGRYQAGDDIGTGDHGDDIFPDATDDATVENGNEIPLFDGEDAPEVTCFDHDGDGHPLPRNVRRLRGLRRVVPRGLRRLGLGRIPIVAARRSAAACLAKPSAL
jgi:hypothetical protein